MRTRAFRPQVDGCLEDRALLSAAPPRPHHPVVLTDRAISKIDLKVRQGFYLYGLDRKAEVLLDEIYQGAVLIPYGRADGLGRVIRGRVAKMERDIEAGVPRSVASAQEDVTSAIRMQIDARVRAGDVALQS